MFMFIEGSGVENDSYFEEWIAVDKESDKSIRTFLEGRINNVKEVGDLRYIVHGDEAKIKSLRKELLLNFIKANLCDIHALKSDLKYDEKKEGRNQVLYVIAFFIALLLLNSIFKLVKINHILVAVLWFNFFISSNIMNRETKGNTAMQIKSKLEIYNYVMEKDITYTYDENSQIVKIKQVCEIKDTLEQIISCKEEGEKFVSNLQVLRIINPIVFLLISITAFYKNLNGVIEDIIFVAVFLLLSLIVIMVHLPEKRWREKRIQLQKIKDSLV